MKARVLCYALNGLGIGHVVRVRAVTRWMRKLAPSMGIELECFYVTSCDADSSRVFDGVPVFKVPSRVTIKSANSDEGFVYAARDCVWAILERLRPELLIVDTVPSGTFNEFIAVPGMDPFRLCGHRVFIHRPVRAEAAQKERFSSMLSRYDLILVPDLAENTSIFLPQLPAERVHFCGPIISYDPSDLLDRKAALAALGVADSSFNIYVSTGGGGHPDADGRIETICHALREMNDAQVLIGAGPLYRGRKFEGRGIIWLNTPEMGTCLRAMDVAISGAGYNSFHELMLAGIPTIFMPLTAALDDQQERALRAERAGAAILAQELFEDTLQSQVQLWRDPVRREAAASAARKLVFHNGARGVAERLLRLLH
jgi:UDP-N-acetylglucosamine--N-acetylmuramyl-(pentapeptide) pyrophosphoryl-undecaprenol N-acetylglucosamine transferase